MDELFQELHGQLKRTRISKLLADAHWCQQVDRNTFYWNDSGALPVLQTVSVSDEI